MLSIGERGYLETTDRILRTAKTIRAGIESMPALRVLGDPLWVIAFDAPGLDIYKVMEFMTQRKWNLNGLHRPPAVHLCVTLRHTQAGVAQRFLADLAAAVEYVQANPGEAGTMAPIYGLAATIPFKAEVRELLGRYIDLLYRV